MEKNRLTWRKITERFSYGCGDFGCNIIYTAMSAFLLYYYTDYAKVSAFAVGVIMMVSRVFDGVSDIIMGVIVDRTKSKYGKARSWILRMCIPFALSVVLLFSVPSSLGQTAKLVYIFITYNLTSTVVYTAINVPYSALNALMTQDPYERSVLSIFRNLLATAGTLIINTVTLPLVEYFGDNTIAWTKTFCVLGLLAVIAFLFTFFGTKERVVSVAQKQSNDRVDVPFAEVQIVGMFFIAMLVKKFGKRNVFALGLILDIVGMLLLNFSNGAMNLIIVSSVIRGIGNACGGATMWAMVSDTIDYGEWKTGYRTEGLVNSACSFGYKIGNGIGSALLGLILEIGGYVGEAAVQSASALVSIKICFVWIPIEVYVCGLIIMKFWKLDKEFDGIIADLKKRAQEV